MDDITREKLLKIALVIFGAIFFTIYPLSLIWPSGWQWHGGHGQYYFQMICGVYAVLGAYLIAAARNPSEHRSLISFTIWSSIVHAGIMAVQATYDGHEMVTWLATCLRSCWSPPCSGIFLLRSSCEWSAHSKRAQFPDPRYHFNVHTRWCAA
jgi:hypothetical protein